MAKTSKTKGFEKLGDPEKYLAAGPGGATHQTADTAEASLTTNQGVVVADNQNTLKSGERGPSLLEDFAFREKITHFDHERIPERIVHARGSGAHGYFEVTNPIPHLTMASFLAEKGKKTEVFARFSTVAGGAGAGDLPRDVRGFAVKFYTDEGNFDLVGNNIPVFFIQDAIKFPDLIHSVKMEPDRGYPQDATAHDTFWDFISLLPESMNMVLWIMSDRTIPRSFRMMEGFGIHTFRLVNADGKSTFVKFHWRPTIGSASVIWDEAVKINGADPDFHRRDLYEAIAKGALPEWEFGVQAFDEEQAEGFRLRRPGPDENYSGGSHSHRSRRADGAGSQSRQLLCRDGAGRVPSGSSGSGHRFHQRPAPAGAPVLLHRHPDQPARRGQFSRVADQPSALSNAEFATRRHASNGCGPGPGVLRAQ